MFTKNGIIKCVVIGDSAIGKSTFLNSYTKNEFNSEMMATVFDNYAKTVTMGGEPYTLGLFDTAGLEDYDKIRSISYPKTDIFLICFSVVDPPFFDNVEGKWIPEITRHCPETPFLLIGTKIDLREDAETIRKLAESNQEPVTFEQGENLAKEMKAVKYVECSALTRKGLNDVFQEAILAAVESPKPAVKKGKCSIL